MTVLEPYCSPELLTEGLDWEAEQGEKAFWAVMAGREAGDVTERQGFFDKDTDAGEDLVEEGDS